MEVNCELGEGEAYYYKEDDDHIDPDIDQSNIVTSSPGEVKKHKKKRRLNKLDEEDILENKGEVKQGELKKHKKKRPPEKGILENKEKAEMGFKKDKRGALNSGKFEKQKKKKLPHEDEDAEDMSNVYYIPSGDEQCCRGMNKWLKEYHESRPGLEVLQQRIDDFIAMEEEKIEQERKEREGRDEEEGWTVVALPRGRRNSGIRKKIGDGKNGSTTFHASSAASARRSMAKKKSKGAALDFYRFQRKEAKMNEILALQSKFERDRLKIQQLRTARKFKPY